jgi:hypothetical protein
MSEMTRAQRMNFIVECDVCGKKQESGESSAETPVKCEFCGREIPPGVPRTKVEISESGNPIFRYAAREKDFELAVGDDSSIERITSHIETYVGPIKMVFHEMISDLVHIDVHQIAPSPERPYWTLVTSGMSDRPMTVPEGDESPCYLEIMLGLPRDWPMDEASFHDERNYWPIRWLKTLARFPHEYSTYIGWGHSMPNGDPPEPLAENTRLCGFVLLHPFLLPEAFQKLEVDAKKSIYFAAVYPLYEEEMAYKLKHGTRSLVERLQKAGVTEVVDVRRKNSCKKSLWPF